MRSGDFGPQLLKVLKARSMSQVALSKKMGVTKSCINLYIRGTRDPGLDSLLRLLKALDMTLEEIFKQD